MTQREWPIVGMRMAPHPFQRFCGDQRFDHTCVCAAVGQDRHWCGLLKEHPIHDEHRMDDGGEVS